MFLNVLALLQNYFAVQIRTPTSGVLNHCSLSLCARMRVLIFQSNYRHMNYFRDPNLCQMRR